VQPNPRLRFGDAADRRLSEQVAALRPATRAISRNAVVNHLRPRWGTRRMDAIGVDDAASWSVSCGHRASLSVRSE
jgi:hypothetical protein